MNSDQFVSAFCGELVIPKSAKEKHPHLTDKMVVDLINGIEVIKDHNKVAQAESSSRLKRFLGGISGSTQRRQVNINKNVAESLRATSHWLQKHESDFLIVNSSLSVISEKLLETRQGVMRLDQKLNKNLDEVRDCIEELESTVNQKNQRLEEYITSVDLRTQAENQLLSEDRKWQAGLFIDLPVELRVYSLLDNLRNGPFQLYLNTVKQPAERTRLQNDVKNTLNIRVANDIGISPGDKNLKGFWFKTIQSINHQRLTPEEHHSITYLSSWTTESTPVTHTVNQALLDKYDDAPHVFNMKRWIDRGINEQLGKAA